MIARIREWILTRVQRPDSDVQVPQKLSFNELLITRMIRIYCREKHREPLCPECKSLLDYAVERLKKCPMKKDKPPCSLCHIHCFQGEWKDRILTVMRFTGPKMIFRHPLMALRFIRQKEKWQRYYNELRL